MDSGEARESPGTIVVSYGNLTDMIADSMNTWRVHLSTGLEWSTSAGEAAAMWRAIGYVYSHWYDERYWDAYSFVSEQVKATPERPAREIALDLMAHMRRWL